MGRLNPFLTNCIPRCWRYCDGDAGNAPGIQGRQVNIPPVFISQLSFSDDL